ncbi:PAS domain S-box protein [Mucilaginibacter sp. McL0603]|uniref:PAS domain S-box protein n=1 Tax=Mucilaginibacter sp. McL0603 TaxID=3415670 RepID=UPI003CF5687B
MIQSLKILHIEDIPSDAELIERTLKKSGIEFEKLLVDTKEEYIKALDNFNPDVILSDHSLPAFNSLEALKILRQRGANTPFILITATVSEEFAVSVMKEGASDYVLKDRLQRLPNAIINAIGKHQSDNERQVYLDKIFASETLFTKAELLAEFGTWRIDLATNSTNWSPGTYKLLGYEQGEVEPTYENFLKNIHPDDVSTVDETFKRSVRSIQPYKSECRIINKDGSIRYLRRQFEFELDGEGKPAVIIGFNQDITREKLAQMQIEQQIEELRAAADRQSAILNALPPNIVLLNEAGKIVAVNDSWKKFTIVNNLGVPRYGIGFNYLAISEKATGMDASSVKKISKGIKEVIADEKNEFSMEYCYYSGSQKLWFQLIVAPLTDKTRKGAVVLHIDITARKQAEELLLQSRANLQTVFENTDIAYVLCDIEHRVISFNTKANELCLAHFNKRLKVGSDALIYFPKNKIPNLKDLFRKIMNNERINYETTYDLKDGTVRWYEVRWVGVADTEKINIGFIVAFKDITERKISELENARITADLVQHNNDLEKFAYIVSHNLRAPVANIIGASNVLNNIELSKADKEKLSRGINISAMRLDEVINDLNQILQVKGGIDEIKEKVRFSELVDHIKVSIMDLIDKNNIEIKYDFSEINEFFVLKPYLYSVFFNLISNSIKYRRQEVDSIIEIRSRLQKDRVELIFTDNGMGIDLKKNAGQIFGLYKRFHSNIEGKGMGLFMVKTQVETLGGEISVESEENSGTEFKIEFKI